VFFSSDPNPRCAAIVGEFHQSLSALATLPMPNDFTVGSVVPFITILRITGGS
jgi:hypothetical protein